MDYVIFLNVFNGLSVHFNSLSCFQNSLSCSKLAKENVQITNHEERCYVGRRARSKAKQHICHNRWETASCWLVANRVLEAADCRGCHMHLHSRLFVRTDPQLNTTQKNIRRLQLQVSSSHRSRWEWINIFIIILKMLLPRTSLIRLYFTLAKLRLNSEGLRLNSRSKRSDLYTRFHRSP